MIGTRRRRRRAQAARAMRARSAPERSNVFRQAAQAAEPFPIEVLEAHWFLIEQAQRGRFELRRHETVAKLLDDREVA